MSSYTRLQKAFEGAPRLPLNGNTKYVLFSDCHRGIGTANDNFLKNQTLYVAALRHYYQTNYTYIELGDGDELWENRRIEPIIESHCEVFRILSRFYLQGRLYLLYGNHDMVKQKQKYVSGGYTQFPSCCGCNPHLERTPLLPDLQFFEGIILEVTPSSSASRFDNAASRFDTAGAATSVRNVYLTHGHQADLLNSKFWKFSRFLVRYLWKPLERYGVLDPTSAAKNYTRKRKTERLLQDYAQKENVILITGHTHRPVLLEEDLSYCNSGSCVHPYSITCLEIERLHISLVKWSLTAGPNMMLYATREILSGPFPLTAPPY